MADQVPKFGWFITFPMKCQKLWKDKPFEKRATPQTYFQISMNHSPHLMNKNSSAAKLPSFLMLKKMPDWIKHLN